MNYLRDLLKSILNESLTYVESDNQTLESYVFNNRGSTPTPSSLFNFSSGVSGRFIYRFVSIDFALDGLGDSGTRGDRGRHSTDYMSTEYEILTSPRHQWIVVWNDRLFVSNIRLLKEKNFGGV